MKKIGLLSDTHGYLHPDAFEFFKGCDEIWHAGDIVDDFILDELAAIAPTVRAVYGNCDDWDIRREIPENQVSLAKSTRWPSATLWAIRANITLRPCSLSGKPNRQSSWPDIRIF